MKTRRNKSIASVSARRVAALVCSLAILNVSAAAAGGFTNVRPFEYSKGQSESLTSLYSQWTPLETRQASVNELLRHNPFVPSLVSQLQPNRDSSIAVKSFSKLDSSGYYTRSALKGDEPSTAESIVYGILGIGVLGGSMYLQARELQYDFEVLRK